MTMNTEPTPTARSAPNANTPSPEMNQMMDSVLQQRENQVCADCPAKRPRWVSFVATDSNGNSPKRLGVLVCSDCARRHHYELGEKRCHIHYLKMAHEFSLQDVETLQRTGNAVINPVLEGALSKEDFDKKLVVEREEQEDERRSKFIKYKYKKHKYKDQLRYRELMLQLLTSPNLKAGQPQEGQGKSRRDDPQSARSGSSTNSPKREKSKSSPSLLSPNKDKDDRMRSGNRRMRGSGSCPNLLDEDWSDHDDNDNRSRRNKRTTEAPRSKLKRDGSMRLQKVLQIRGGSCPDLLQLEGDPDENKSDSNKSSRGPRSSQRESQSQLNRKKSGNGSCPDLEHWEEKEEADRGRALRKSGSAKSLHSDEVGASSLTSKRAIRKPVRNGDSNSASRARPTVTRATSMKGLRERKNSSSNLMRSSDTKTSPGNSRARPKLPRANSMKGLRGPSSSPNLLRSSDIAPSQLNADWGNGKPLARAAPQGRTRPMLARAASMRMRRPTGGGSSRNLLASSGASFDDKDADRGAQGDRPRLTRSVSYSKRSVRSMTNITDCPADRPGDSMGAEKAPTRNKSMGALNGRGLKTNVSGEGLARMRASLARGNSRPRMASKSPLRRPLAR